VFPNGKLYFGISNDPKGRFRAHCKVSSGKYKISVYNAIRKYGAENVKLEILVAGERSYIANLEIAAIAKYRTQDRRYGYNITNGGEVSPMSTKSVAEKVGRTLKGRKPSPQCIANSVRARKGKKASPETLLKLSLVHKGCPCKEETKAKISAALMGQPCSEEKKKSISAKLAGVKHTPERKANNKIAVQLWWDKRRGILSA
jgi:hypothetical protein